MPARVRARTHARTARGRELVVVAGLGACRGMIGVLRAAGHAVAEALSLSGLRRLLGALGHEGVVFVGEELLGPEPAVTVGRLADVAPLASFVVVGAGPPPDPATRGVSTRWIRPESPPLEVVAAAVFAGSEVEEVRPSALVLAAREAEEREPEPPGPRLVA